MRSWNARAALTMMLVATSLPLPLLTHTAAAQTAGDLSLTGESELSPRLREFTLRTPALVTRSLGLLPGNAEGQVKIRVLLPEGYDPNGTTRYPVLYLFHGGTENHAVWTTPATKGKAEELTRGLPLIVVMPDGGVAGGYADWFNGGAYGPPQWKTFHLDQLVPWIDARYRTIANRGGRATAGLSMGGGGLRYAAQRPDLFGATAAFSGDIDILQPASDWNGMGAPISKMIWGDRQTQEVNWRGVNGPDLAKNLSNTQVAIYTGDTGRPEGVYILQGSTAVHQRLDSLGIAHSFAIYPGMMHSWPTWNKALAEWLPGLMAHFAAAQRAPATTPATFSYSSVAPRYEIYGWNVAVTRKAAEFSALEVTGPRAFTVVGSGDALVQTPPLARPGARLRVTIAGKAITATADAAGRLSVPVHLGPANPFQQYSPEAKAAATGASQDATPFLLFDNGSRFYRAKVRIAPSKR